MLFRSWSCSTFPTRNGKPIAKLGRTIWTEEDGLKTTARCPLRVLFLINNQPLGMQGLSPMEMEIPDEGKRTGRERDGGKERH